MNACRVAIQTRLLVLASCVSAVPALAFEHTVTSTSSVASPFYDDGSEQQIVSKVSTTGPATARTQVGFDVTGGATFLTRGKGTANQGHLTINIETRGAAGSFSASGFTSVATRWADTITIYPTPDHPDGSLGIITVIAPVTEEISYTNTGPDDNANVVTASLGINPGLGDGGRYALADNPPPGNFVLEPGSTQFLYGRPIIMTALLFARSILTPPQSAIGKSANGRFRLAVSRVRVTDLAGVEQFGLKLTSESGHNYLRPASASPKAH